MSIASKLRVQTERLEMLPTLPGIALQILNTVRNDEKGVREIGELIAKDPSLSAAVLKMVNSSFYGLKTKVASVPHAVGLLGEQTVKNLALSFCLVKRFKLDPKEGFEISQFWKASLIGAIATQELAADLMPDLTDEAFFVGLLQDIGIIAMIHCMPEQYELVLNESRTAGISLHSAEASILGVTHYELGASLLASWDLPEIISIPIGSHHKPNTLAAPDEKLAALTQILHLGSLFIDLILHSNKTLTLGLIEQRAVKFGFDAKLDLDRVAGEVQRQTKEIFPWFDIEAESDATYVEIIDAARGELIRHSRSIVAALNRQKQEIDQLRESVSRDSMTGLYNYRCCMELLDQEIYRARRYQLPLSVVMADIDHFKEVNDNHGHLAGDMVIKQLAHLLRQSVRTSDYVARYGGEEFILILPETGTTGARTIAERLRQKVEQSALKYDGVTIPITVSFGITSKDREPHCSVEKMISEADQALYLAKQAGRNCCCQAENGDELPPA